METNKQTKMAMKGFTLTLKAPRRNNVGCSPTENINRRIVEAIKARMPWGLGRAMTMAREMSMAVQSSPDQCGSRVPATRRQSSQRSGLSPHRGHTGAGSVAIASTSSLGCLVPALTSRFLPQT